jgi:diguanylate cyclase (GGDEF)-like protein
MTNIIPQLPFVIVPVFYAIPAYIAFVVAFYLKKRTIRDSPGVNYLKMLFYISLAEGIHNSYYLIATSLRILDPGLYEIMMLPVPWTLAQGIITAAFLVFGFYFIKEQNIEIGNVGHLRESAEKFKEMAEFDELTGLRNRRTLYDLLEKEVTRGARMRHSTSVMMIDLDGFKFYNDTLGHQEGDRLLQLVAETLASHLRAEVDLAFRYGGDEFFIIFPETSLPQARSIGERLNSGISEKTGGKITSSIGLLELKPGATVDINKLIHLADKAMYSAKRQGGNTIFSMMA